MYICTWCRMFGKEEHFNHADGCGRGSMIIVQGNKACRVPGYKDHKPKWLDDEEKAGYTLEDGYYKKYFIYLCPVKDCGGHDRSRCLIHKKRLMLYIFDFL